MELTVQLKDNSYPIYIQNNLLDHAADYIADIFSGERICIVSDDNVAPLYAEKIMSPLQQRGFSCALLTLPSGERTKNFSSLETIYAELLRHGITRSDLLIALGGGVIGDLAGFAAATFLRGIPFVQIPTSLLAQVDSSVGGKVAVDLKEGKNLAGAFYQPRLVLIDPTVLSSLPARYMHDGMGEVIKYGCILSADLFAQLEHIDSYESLAPHMTDIIYQCVDCKRRIVEIDPTDKKERMLLNFGHTLAHGIETYENFAGMSHGEAVACGMYMITLLSEKQGLTQPGTSKRLADLLSKYSLPRTTEISIDELLPIMQRDKKNMDGKLNLILIKEIGQSFIYRDSLQFFKKEC